MYENGFGITWMNDGPLLRKSGIPSPDFPPGSTGAGLPDPPCARSTCCAPLCRSAGVPSGSTSPRSPTPQPLDPLDLLDPQPLT